MSMPYMSQEEILHNLETLPLDEFKSFVRDKLPCMKRSGPDAVRAFDLIYSRWPDAWDYQNSSLYSDFYLSLLTLLRQDLENRVVLDVCSGIGALWFNTPFPLYLILNDISSVISDLSSLKFSSLQLENKNLVSVLNLSCDMTKLDIQSLSPSVLFQLNGLYYVQAGARLGFYHSVAAGHPEIIITGTNGTFRQYMLDWPESMVNSKYGTFLPAGTSYKLDRKVVLPNPHHPNDRSVDYNIWVWKLS